MTDETQRQRAVSEALDRPLTSRMRAEAELEWYYTEGQTLERSPTGGMLDALRMAASLQVDCPVCCSKVRKMRAAGLMKRIHLIDPERIGEAIFQAGILPTGEVCGSCSGSGVVTSSLEAIKASNQRKDSHRKADEAPEYEVTARPTGHEVRDHGFDADDHRKLRCGHVSSCLCKLDPVHRSGIAAYYGPDATRCAPVAPWGMFLAVMPLCDAGKALLAEARESTTASLHPIERIRVEAVYEASLPKPWRGELLAKGLVEATAMLDAATDAFAEEL